MSPLPPITTIFMMFLSVSGLMSCFGSLPAICSITRAWDRVCPGTRPRGTLQAGSWSRSVRSEKFRSPEKIYDRALRVHKSHTDEVNGAGSYHYFQIVRSQAPVCEQWTFGYQSSPFPVTAFTRT